METKKSVNEPEEEKKSRWKKIAEEIWDWRNYLLYSEGNHHFYADLFLRKKLLDDYQ